MGGLFSKKFHPPSLREGLSFYRDGEAQGKEARGRDVSKPSFLGWREGSLLLGRSIGQGDGVLITRFLLTFPIHLSSFKKELVADTCELAAGACILFSPDQPYFKLQDRD